MCVSAGPAFPARTYAIEQLPATRLHKQVASVEKPAMPRTGPARPTVRYPELASTGTGASAIRTAPRDSAVIPCTTAAYPTSANTLGPNPGSVFISLRKKQPMWLLKFLVELSSMVPGTGIEPVCLAAADLKSAASSQFRHPGVRVLLTIFDYHVNCCVIHLSRHPPLHHRRQNRNDDDTKNHQTEILFDERDIPE